MSTLAIDQGTTSTRAVLVDAAGRLSVVLSRPNPQAHPGPGRVEQDAERLLADVRDCLAVADELAGGTHANADGDHDPVTAVGIDNQGESCLAWDADTGRPVGPLVSWQDDRTRADVERLAADGAAEEIRARSGLPLDAYFSASKLAWLLREQPEARRLASKGRLRLGTTDAFFRERLTGRFETDVTTASRTSLMNLASGEWDAELCRLFGVPLELLPPIGPSSGEFGTLRAGRRELPLGASLVDQQASLYGHGCRSPGDTKMTFGTGAFVSCVTGGTIVPDNVHHAAASSGGGGGHGSASRHGGNGAASGARADGNGALPTVAWQRGDGDIVYALDGGVHTAAAAVDWGRGLGLFDDYAELNAFDAPPAVTRGLVFVPALVGLACPHWDRRARGAWMGLAPEHTRGDLMQAVLEGVALRVREVVAAIGTPPGKSVSIDGGMSANPWFRQFLADALGRELVVPDETELTALGTALLAAEATGRPFSPRHGSTCVAPRPLPDGVVETFTAARAAVQHFGEIASAAHRE